MAGSYYNDPSGYGSWWVEEGQTPEEARQGIESNIGTSLMNFPVGDLAYPTGGRLGTGALTAPTAVSPLAAASMTNPTPTTTSSTGFRVKMPDGTYQTFPGITEDLNKALQGGGTLMRPDGSAATLSQFNGGWLADNQPLNVFMGGQWLPGQQEALAGGGLAQASGGSAPAAPSLLGNYTARPAAQGAAAPTVDTNTSTTELLNQIMKLALATQGTEGRGYSPEALAAMRTQAIEAVPARFDAQGRSLATKLLRDNPAGLPGGGDIMRAYGPYLTAREGTRASLLQNAVLANEAEKVRSREADRAFGLQSVGLAGQLAGQRGQLELGQQQLGQQWEIAKLSSNTQLELSRMGITSNEQLAQMQNQLQRDLASQGIDANLVLRNIDADTQIKVARINQEGGSWAKVLTAGLLSTIVQSKAGQGLITGAVDWIAGKLGVGGAAVAGGAAAGGAAAAGGGFGSSIGAFLTNPLTIGIGATLAIGGAILKSQAHWEANEAVAQFENPFAQDFLIPFHDNFFKAAEAGALTKDQASAAIQELTAAWDEYQAKIKAWAQGSSDKTTVANQSIANLRSTVTTALSNMNKYMMAA